MSKASRSTAPSSSIRVRGLAAASLLLVVAGCSAAAPTASPTAVTPSPDSSPSITPVASVVPTPSQTAKSGPLNVLWSKSADPATPAAGDWEPMNRPTWTKLGGTFVMAIGSQGDESGPRIWLSEDAIHWRAVTVHSTPDQTISIQAVTTGGPGLIAAGEVTAPTDDVPLKAYWTSPDGVSWTRATDPGLTEGQLWLLRATAEGAVTYDASGVQVTAYQGPAWEGNNPLTIVASAGTVTAFVGDTTGRPIEVWESSRGSAWSKVGSMPGADGGNVLRAAHGPAGWVAFGCGADCTSSVAWTSADGRTWATLSDPGFDQVRAIAADRAGFVAVGHRVTGLGCAVGEGDIFGETWTSSTGRTWRRMPDDPSFNRASIHVLLVSGRTMVGLGPTWPADGGPTSTAWTFALPDASSDEGVVPSPTPSPSVGPSPSGEGCGG